MAQKFDSQKVFHEQIFKTRIPGSGTLGIFLFLIGVLSESSSFVW
jgi:hypothetical protein